MLIGEQPGNEEDIQGHPFVGPAGKLLDRALAGRRHRSADVYVTNAVKHFKFEERGKRRLHKKPRMSEVKACRPWLEAEVAADQTGGDRLPGRNGGAIRVRAAISLDEGAREIRRACLGALM